MGGALLGPFGRHELGAAIVTIGRSSSNTLVLNDSQVSGRHAEIHPAGAGYVLLDLGSANGTMLNGQMLAPQAPQPLHSGDTISIGSSTITVELAPAIDAYAPTEHLSAPIGSAFAPTQRMGAPPNLPTYGTDATYAPPLPPPPLYPASGVYIAPPPARRRSSARRIWLIVGGIVALLAVIACACIGLLLYIASTHSPQSISDQYYSDIKKQDYAGAYQLLSALTQARLDVQAQQNHISSGQQLFTDVFACLDAQLGAVSSYSLSLQVQDKVHAVVSANVTRPREKYRDTIYLIPENGNWAIQSSSSPPNQHCPAFTSG